MKIQRNWMFIGAMGLGLLKAVAAPVHFVTDGEPKGYVVVADSAAQADLSAAEYFIQMVTQSTGAELLLLNESQVSDYPNGPRLYIGDTQAAKKQGVSIDKDAQETYRIVAKDDAVFIVGSADNRRTHWFSARSRPVLWALNRILEEQLGVLWLWPGELGTHVPQHAGLAIPEQDVTYQPELMIRMLRIGLSAQRQLASANPAVERLVAEEAVRWLENHQVGRRGRVQFGHAFSHWWDKYSAQQPDLFAVPPEGIAQTIPGRVKLRLANPDVIEQIVLEYQEAGAPDYYNVCPNDGGGFDTSKETLSWDIPRDQDLIDIWYARGNLTARYVKFWNLLYERLVKINPDVRLATYAYSAYREPPPKERPLTARMIIGIVDTYDNYEGWSGWAATGSGMVLRPNWWHQGGNAPYLPLAKTANFIHFAAQNGMEGMDMDSVIGYWATQGINYYLGARLMTRPELSLDEIVAEYTSAFGPAANEIKQYLQYWEKLSNEYNYPLNATGGIRPLSVKSRYEDLVREGKFGLSILNGSKYALPYLYGDEVIEPAERILSAARAKVEPRSVYAQRIDFLQSGLDELRATRDVIALGQELKSNQSQQKMREFTEKARALEMLREKLAGSHVVWAEAIKRHEDRYRVLVRPEHLQHHKIQLDGL